MLKTPYVWLITIKKLLNLTGINCYEWVSLVFFIRIYQNYFFCKQPTNQSKLSSSIIAGKCLLFIQEAMPINNEKKDSNVAKMLWHMVEYRIKTISSGVYQPNNNRNVLEKIERVKEFCPPPLPPPITNRIRNATESVSFIK